MSLHPSLHLDDARLLALAAGEPAAADEAAHLAACPVCASDRAAFGAVRAAAARDAEPPASPFATARAQRDLLRAIGDDARRQRRALRPGFVGALAASSAALGAVVALAWHGAWQGAWQVPVPPAPSAPAVAVAPVAPIAPIAPGAPIAPVAPVAPVDEAVALRVPLAPLPARAAPLERRNVRAPEPAAPLPARVEAEALIARGDGVGAARVLVIALDGGEAVAADLALVLRRFPGAFDAVADDLARIGAREGGSADALRLRCAQGLLARRDLSTVEACRSFGRAFPQDPAARTLALAAGRVAEDDLGDLALAEEEYERALLLAPFSGLPATDALLARARVRAKQGELDEARADLRLYLHQEPAARHQPDVAALMQSLAVP
jgi:hypothetical protein